MTDGTVRVFEVDFDVSEDHFQTLLIDGDDDFSRPWFSLISSPNSVWQQWRPPPLYADRPTRPRPDFVLLWGGLGPVLAATVPQDLRDLLAISGELLPVDVEGERLSYLHVTEVLNVLDRDASVWEGGAARVLEFHAHRFYEVPLFRIPENNSAQVFCLEGFGEFQFKTMVEERGLTGLRFVEAWNSVVGGIRKEPRW